ncbi:MAG: FAD-dependent tricarballylate dehydrogenase TcuA [Polynucleobacter sp.]|nr:MAG: FAD-dependent tricarballylate dehydrogenase TcuA [Polynucleobacter sp.]
MYDLLVIGGGNAALCAAIKAREAGLSVLLLESAPREWRGGNSIHTRNLRCMHDAPQDVLTEAYPEEEYWQDLLKVTGGLTNERLAKLVIRESSRCRPWMMKHGVRFQGSLSGTLHLSRTNAFFLGGGKALVNAYFRSAEKLGIEIRYNTNVTSLNVKDGTFYGAYVGDEYIEAKSCVVASGGFESNKAWLKEAWGPVADNFLIRGTRYNMGVVLKDLLAKGADQIGDPTQGHAVAIDARAPEYDGGICTRIDCVSLGIVVNKNAQRFYDEGEDFWPKRYAIWGRLVAGQPDQIAHSIIDQKAIGRFMPPVFPGVVADTLEELAEGLGLDVQAFVKTVTDYNQACTVGQFDHSVLDGCQTKGIEPAKTNWAQPINHPPYYGYTLRPGITFTYLGVQIDEEARILFGGKPSQNLFAAGEVMAGNVLGKGYLAGIGMSIGTVFGLVAGESAAKELLGASV